MDESAPITWLIGRINTIVASGVNASAAGIAHAIMPMVAVCFVIYVLLMTANLMRGGDDVPVVGFMKQLGGFLLIVAFGLNMDYYTDTVIPIVTGLGGDLASAVSGGTVSAGTLDQLALHYLTILNDGYDEVHRIKGLSSIGPMCLFLLKAAMVLVGLIPFLVSAALLLITADVGSVLIASVGPLFIACLLFPATKQYFSAWVNTAVSYALMPLFVAVISTLSVGLSKEMLSDGSGLLTDASLAVVFLAMVGNLMLVQLLRVVSALASSLSAGGINAGSPGGLSGMATSVGHGVRGSLREIKALRRNRKEPPPKRQSNSLSQQPQRSDAAQSSNTNTRPPPRPG